MTGLAQIEKLEFQCIGVLARKNITSAQRQRFGKLLGELRVAKAAWLADHPEILRKLGTESAPKDKPNAPHPHADGSTGDIGLETTHFRAPAELASMVLHTCRGALTVPPSGIVEVAADHTDLHAELKGRGFHEMQDISRFGKAADGSDPVAQFRPDRLQQLQLPAFGAHRS
jgi:hypothetical protein